MHLLNLVARVGVVAVDPHAVAAGLYRVPELVGQDGPEEQERRRHGHRADQDDIQKIRGSEAGKLLEEVRAELSTPREIE